MTNLESHVIPASASSPGRLQQAWMLFVVALLTCQEACAACNLKSLRTRSTHGFGAAAARPDALRRMHMLCADDSRLASALNKVAMSTKARDVRTAITVVAGALHEPHASDDRTLEVLFAACRSCAGGKKAVALLRQCNLLHIEPSARCYNYALEACLKFGDGAEAEQLLRLFDAKRIPFSMTAALRLWSMEGGHASSRGILHRVMTPEAVALLVGDDASAAHLRQHRRVLKRRRAAARAQCALGRGHLPAVTSLLESMARRPDGVLDLHGITAQQATCGVLALLEDSRRAAEGGSGGAGGSGSSHGHCAMRDWSQPLVLITGRGRGSKDGVPVLKPALASLLRRRGLVVEEPALNPGVLIVTGVDAGGEG